MSLMASSSSDRPSTPSATDSSDKRSRSTEVETGFGEAAAQRREAATKAEAYADLKKRQDAWRQAEKTVKDLQSVKDRSSDEESRLEEAKRYMLLNQKPAGAGRKTRRGKKKASKKSRKTKGRRA